MTIAQQKAFQQIMEAWKAYKAIKQPALEAYEAKVKLILSRMKGNK